MEDCLTCPNRTLLKAATPSMLSSPVETRTTLSGRGDRPRIVWSCQVSLILVSSKSTAHECRNSQLLLPLTHKDD